MNIAQNIAKSPAVAANAMKAAYSTAAPSSKIYRDAMTGEVTSLPDIDVSEDTGSVARLISLYR